MAAVPTLIALKSPAINQLRPMATEQRNPSGPRGISKATTATQKPKGYTLLLGAVEPLELRQ